ncbi:hypothetical protein [Acinetobacter indicus]|jgi:hypothetical protein|uniref:hypothetical protein n=1 Tax=Acinetobacter indicus TaxID=756892 RepID=UPI000948EC0E|nr:hypothetical protein [Acinetobacter indicus]
MDLNLIKANAPAGTEFFAPAPEWVGGAFYFKQYAGKILMMDIDRKWVHACDTVEDLLCRGGLPITYEPINWIERLSKI